MISGLQIILVYLSKAPVELVYILLIQKYRMMFLINCFIISHPCALNFSGWELENTSHRSMSTSLGGSVGWGWSVPHGLPRTLIILALKSLNQVQTKTTGLTLAEAGCGLVQSLRFHVEALPHLLSASPSFLAAGEFCNWTQCGWRGWGEARRSLENTRQRFPKWDPRDNVTFSSLAAICIVLMLHVLLSPFWAWK